MKPEDQKRIVIYSRILFIKLQRNFPDILLSGAPAQSCNYLTKFNLQLIRLYIDDYTKNSGWIFWFGYISLHSARYSRECMCPGKSGKYPKSD